MTRREHSRKELARKLTGRGVESAEAAAVIDKLAEAGWQDDARFAESVVRSRASAGYGPGWIRAELGTHGLGPEAVSAAMEAYQDGWIGAARDLLRRRFGVLDRSDAGQRRKALDLLLRRGFAMSLAKAALQDSDDGD